MMNNTVTIDAKEYIRLLHDSALLQELYAAGVDNWEGYELALEALGEDDGE